MTEQTEQQKNIELLEACGWKNIHYDDDYSELVGIPPDDCLEELCPNVINDLNVQAKIIYPELIKRKVKFGVGCLPELEDKSILYKAYIVSQRHCKFGDKLAPTFAEAALKYFRSVK